MSHSVGVLPSPNVSREISDQKGSRVMVIGQLGKCLPRSLGSFDWLPLSDLAALGYTSMRLALD